ILTSPDGNRWTTRSHTLPSSLVGVTYGKDRFAAVAADGGVLVSGDGIDWTNQYLGTNTQLKRVAFGNETFVAIGGLLDTASGWWTNRALVSPDSLHWTQAYADSTSSQPWVGITFGINLFVAVAWDGIFTSPDGASWTARKAGTTERRNLITYGIGVLVTAGENGWVLRPGVVLSFMSPASASDHVLTLSVSSEIGLRQEFQVSTNLVHWSTFTNLTNTNFRTEVVDPKAGVSPRRFYRAKE